MKKVIGIRCISYDDQTKVVYGKIKEIFPNYSIYFIVDNVNRDAGEFPENLNVEFMTSDKLNKLNLYLGDSKIGWLAGDYSYYMLLKYNWDYMWLIEPDVFISSDLYDTLRKIDQNQVDLISAYYGERDDSWMWTKILRQSTKFNRIFWAFFPFTRLSRSLVESSLKVRQEISQTVVENDLPLPNDESVIGTVAHWKNMSTLSLKKSYPKEMKYFNLRVRYNFKDMDNKSGIFHPVDFQEKFDKKIINQLNKQIGDSPVRYSLKYASDETKLRILKNL